MSGCREVRTSSIPPTHGPVTRIRAIATNIPHPRIQQPFPIKVLAEKMFDAPETAGGQGAFFGVVGDGLGGGGAGGVEGHVGGGGEGAEEAGEEGGEGGEGH